MFDEIKMYSFHFTVSTRCVCLVTCSVHYYRIASNITAIKFRRPTATVIITHLLIFITHYVEAISISLNNMSDLRHA